MAIDRIHDYIVPGKRAHLIGIGGVSMSGGSGKWHGVVIGSLMIAVIANGLDIMRVDSNWQPVIKGAIIILAVLLDIRSKRRSR